MEAPPPSSAKSGRSRSRLALSVLLIALAVLLAPISVAASWVNSEISDGSRYEQTVSPLVRDTAVQDVIATRASADLVGRIDVRTALNSLARILQEHGFPPAVVSAVRNADSEVKDGLTQGTSFVIKKFVKSEVFARAWDSVNRRAHDAAMNVLTGDGDGPIRIRGDSLVLDIGTVVEEAQKELIGTTLIAADTIPGKDRSVVLFRSPHLAEARDGARWLEAVGPWAPVACVTLAAFGIGLSPCRRTALTGTAAGTGFMMVSFLVALRFGRQVFLDAAAPTVQSQEATGAVYDYLVRFLRESVLVALVTSLAVALVAHLAGPSKDAVAVRSSAAQVTGSMAGRLGRTGWDSGAFGRWLREHRTGTVVTIVGAGVLTLLLWPYPTLAVSIAVLITNLVVLSIAVVLAEAAPPGAPGTAVMRKSS
ncbi:hypothetical protein WN71_008115 [Streptomyces mangrovisoli]|uniref:Aromatic ring-opening dioxygenase LigA n=1 Tax=Streptomyces mangrovisoli TaxID=1428628 RepID=A0A1J4P0W9_9ACTN|nr:hypothetical protein WN71_008115 [Streptomyces mangrovisoli]